jgi:SM-20-related protein
MAVATAATPSNPGDDILESLWAGLLRDGIAVQDDFLPSRKVRALVGCAERRRAQGGFRAARVGADRESIRRGQVRGDFTCWLDEPLFADEHALLGRFEALRLHINREAFLGLFELELHYAWYPPGAGYARHVDQLRGRTQRVLSVIVYLNEGWATGDGGELRFFEARGQRDIEPRGGRLVCFLADGREHAVMPTRTDRLSITGWFRQNSPA